MKEEMELLGLKPGTPSYLKRIMFDNGVSLWRFPPPGEYQKREPNQLPTPEAFQLHPFFVWQPETTFKHLLGKKGLPCLIKGCKGHATKRAMGRPRVVLGAGGGVIQTGQYYILASSLNCSDSKCSAHKSYWQSDNREYMEKLPLFLQEMFPAVMDYNKAYCKSILDRILYSKDRSPTDLVNELSQLVVSNFERAHCRYLRVVDLVRGGVQGNGE